MIEELHSTLSTFTEEAEKAALQKCKDLSFDTNRGVVSLDESFIKPQHREGYPPRRDFKAEADPTADYCTNSVTRLSK